MVEPARRVLAFRLARSGLAEKAPASLASAAACPASDFARDAALLALAARRPKLTRDAYDEAVDAAEKLLVAHVVRGAIHALDPADHALWGRALLATDDDELGVQLGQQVRKLAKEEGFSPAEALDEVAHATKAALARGRKLTKDELHQELRERVRSELMPWCKSCGSHHVAPMLWRFGGVKAGARLDSKRRYLMGKPGRAPAAGEAARRYLRFYGPGTVGEFADWAGLARPHAERIWAEVSDEAAEVKVGRGRALILSEDRDELEDPPEAAGVRLIPAGDPYLQKPNRRLLAPDDGLRKRLFRPVASPGVVLKDGALAGLWKVKAKGKRAEVTVEKLGRIPRRDLEAEAERIAALRDADEALLVID